MQMHVFQIYKSYHNSNLKQETDGSQWVFKFHTQQSFRNVNFVPRVFAMYQVSYFQRHWGRGCKCRRTGAWVHTSSSLWWPGLASSRVLDTEHNLIHLE